MKFRAVSLAAVSVGLFAMPALAHHSFAMFDAEKTIELAGTVKELQWTNPHSWLQVVVNDKQGKPVEWSLEMGGPGGLARQGWKPKTVVEGDKVMVRVHPLKDGSSGGQFLSIVLPNGQKIGQDTPVN